MQYLHTESMVTPAAGGSIEVKAKLTHGDTAAGPVSAPWCDAQTRQEANATVLRLGLSEIACKCSFLHVHIFH